VASPGFAPIDFATSKAVRIEVDHDDLRRGAEAGGQQRGGADRAALVRTTPSADGER